MSVSLDYWNYTLISTTDVSVGCTFEVKPGDVLRVVYPNGLLPGIWPVGSYVVLTRISGEAMFSSSYTPTPDSEGPWPDVIVVRDNFPHFVTAIGEGGSAVNGVYVVTAVEGFKDGGVPVMYHYYRN